MEPRPAEAEQPGIRQSGGAEPHRGQERIRDGFEQGGAPQTPAAAGGARALDRAQVSVGTQASVRQLGALMARAADYEHPGIRQLAQTVARAAVGSVAEVMSQQLAGAVDRGLGEEPAAGEEMRTLSPRNRVD